MEMTFSNYDRHFTLIGEMLWERTHRPKIVEHFHERKLPQPWAMRQQLTEGKWIRATD